MIFNFPKFLFLIKALTIFTFCELISLPEIKASEKILNESNVDLDLFTSYARQSHTDNFILVDKNGAVYKSCLARIPGGCPVSHLFYGYINTPISEEVIQLKNFHLDPQFQL